MALANTQLARLPLTPSILYLVAGIALGPLGVGLLMANPMEHSRLLEVASEIAVLISLFVAGLKLRSALNDNRWAVPVLLATVGMIVTVCLVTLLGVYGLGLPLGAAVLLGGILAPTDPVLASDVQVESASDRDRLRFTLTGEAGLNDGTAFPVVMLGLGLLGYHELGSYGWRWLTLDVLWAVFAGVAIGGLLGTQMARWVVHLRTTHREAVGRDDLLALGLIALSYGAALLVHGYGFLAVFAAGLALRRVERLQSAGAPSQHAHVAASPAVTHKEAVEGVATGDATAPAYMAEAALGFTEQLERVAEVAIVLVLGAMLSTRTFAIDIWWFALALFVAVRPLALLSLRLRRTPPAQFRMLAWFGIRGVGSFYYLMYSLQHGVQGALAERLIAITFTVIVASAVVHGISVTPLMRRYDRLRKAGSRLPFGRERSRSASGI
ncbi:MAG: cation:proton antiporter [Phycisphaerae bacterium]|nr:cation:proton antiporter [Gemmatimonadaceae bacterium]